MIECALLDVSLNSLLALEDELHPLEEGCCDGGRRLAQEDLSRVRQVNAHHGALARRVGAAVAVGAVSQAVYEKKEKTEMKKVCEATAAAAPLISGPNLAVGGGKGLCGEGAKNSPPRRKQPSNFLPSPPFSAFEVAGRGGETKLCIHRAEERIKYFLRQVCDFLGESHSCFSLEKASLYTLLSQPSYGRADFITVKK